MLASSSFYILKGRISPTLVCLFITMRKIRILLLYFDQTFLERVLALFDLTNFIKKFMLNNPLALTYLSQKIKNVRVGEIFVFYVKNTKIAFTLSCFVSQTWRELLQCYGCESVRNVIFSCTYYNIVKNTLK